MTAKSTEVRVVSMEIATGRQSGSDGLSVEVTARRVVPGYYVDSGDINARDMPDDVRLALIAWLTKIPDSAR